MKANKNFYLAALASIVLVIFSILFSSAAFAANAQDTPLTITETRITTSGSAERPDIFGDKIIWKDYRNDNGTGISTDIYIYNLSTSTEVQIATSGSAEIPVIYDDKIVWQDGRNGSLDIYMYDLYTHKEIQITNSESFKESPAIYENRIVWEDTINGSSDIRMCTISGDEPEIKIVVANFSSNVNEGFAPLSVQFTDLSENATGWNWNFGDGTNSTKRNPIHIYSAAGNYIIMLTASNGYGTDMKISEIKVQSAPRTIPGGFNF